MEYAADIVRSVYIYEAINISPMTHLTHCQHADGTDLRTKLAGSEQWCALVNMVMNMQDIKQQTALCKTQ